MQSHYSTYILFHLKISVMMINVIGCCFWKSFTFLLLQSDYFGICLDIDGKMTFLSYFSLVTLDFLVAKYLKDIFCDSFSQ